MWAQGGGAGSRERPGTLCHPDPRGYWATSTLIPIEEDQGDLLPSALPLDRRAGGRRCLDRQKGPGERDLGRHRLLVTWGPRVTAELRSPVTTLTAGGRAAAGQYFLTRNTSAIVTQPLCLYLPFPGYQRRSVCSLCVTASPLLTLIPPLSLFSRFQPTRPIISAKVQILHWNLTVFP